jgi:ABC-type methionine transport system permease subunit
VIAVVVLLILLVEKQRVVGASAGREKTLSRALTIAILPLLAALAVNVLVEVAASVSQGS